MILNKMLGFVALRTGRLGYVWKLTNPDSFVWTEFLRRHGRIKIGEGTSVSPTATFTDWNAVTIGSRCSIASQSAMITHTVSYESGQHEFVIKPILIGDRVRLMHGACVRPGTVVGSDVDVLPLSVVSGTVPTGARMRGNPAVQIGWTRRFEERTSK